MASTQGGQQTTEGMAQGGGSSLVVCPDCKESRRVDAPESNTHSARALCNSCWQKRINYGELYLQAGTDRHHYVCQCGWQTWARSTPLAVRILGLPCFHCGKRWRQAHRCPPCEDKTRS